MKIKKNVLFEQGAYPEARYVPDTYKFDHNEIMFYSFEPRHYDNFVYVGLIDYGGEYTIMVERVKVDKEMIIDNAKVMPANSEAFENIRTAIATFDHLLKNHPMTWEVAEAEPKPAESVDAEDDLPF